MGASSVTTGDTGERSPNKTPGDVVVVVVVAVCASRAAFSAFNFALAAAVSGTRSFPVARLSVEWTSCTFCCL